MSDNDDAGSKNPANNRKNPIRRAVENGQPVTPAPFDVIEGGRNETHSAEPDNTRSNFDEDDSFDTAGDAPTPEEIELAKFCANFDQNDRDNARRLVVWFGANMVYVAGMGWLTWRETHWERDEGELQTRLMAQMLVDKIKLEPPCLLASKAQQVLLDMADTAAKKPAEEQTKEDLALISKAIKARDALSKKKNARRQFAVSSGNAGKTAAMLQQATSLKSIDSELLDADRNALNVKNGTLEFRRIKDPNSKAEGEESLIADVTFRPHDRADMNTRRAEVNYDPDADWPHLRSFLNTVHPDPKMQLFIQVFHGYALLGGNDEQKLIYHYGSGANGKSAFVEALGRLCGQYRAVVSPDTITGDSNRQGQQASPDIARLFNARVITIEELPRGTPLRENLIKAVSGGTRMTARFLQKDIFEFEPIFTAILTGNDMPEISGTDDGIWRRLLLVEWGVTVPEKDRITPAELTRRFDSERSGMLNWLLDGLRMYLENGLDKYIPAQVADFTKSYREDRDPVGQFVEACVIRAPGEQVQARDMYQAYVQWSEANGFRAWKEAAFGRRITGLKLDGQKIEKKKGRLVQYQDVALDGVPNKFDPKTSPEYN